MQTLSRLDARYLSVKVRIWPVPGEIYWKAQRRLPQWIEAARAPVRFCIVRLARPPSSGRRNGLILPRKRAASLNANWRYSPAVPRIAGHLWPPQGRWNIEPPLRGRWISGRQPLPRSGPWNTGSRRPHPGPRTSGWPPLLPPGQWNTGRPRRLPGSRNNGRPPTPEARTPDREGFRSLRKRFHIIR
jgi:hypothetical protein